MCVSIFRGSGDFHSIANPALVPITFGIFKKQRQWAKPFIQRQVVSRKTLNVCEVCIPGATSKDRLLTVVSELISSYKDQIGVIALQSSEFLIASRC